LRSVSLVVVGAVSLVLPLAASAGRPAVGRAKVDTRPVWAGQLTVGAGGLWVIMVPAHPVIGVAFTVAGCLAWLPVVRRRMRPV
jgi:hypothetical protein